MKRQTKAGIAILLGLALASCPFILNNFHVHFLTEVMIFSIFGVGFNLLLGHGGFLSLGHACYFGLGAYSTALCLVYFPGFPVPLAVLTGSLCGLMGGLIIGLLTLRLKGMYFALGTLAFSQMFWAIAWKWRGLTRGDDGLVGWSSREIFLPLLGNFSLNNITFMFYFVSVATVASILLCWLFTQTPLGNTLASIKSSPERAEFLGVNVHLAKFLLISFSALISAVSGSLYALFEKVVSPRVLDMFMSMEVVNISIFGGFSSFAGPIVGSLFYLYLAEYLSSFTDKWELFMGSLFVLVLLFYPKGLMGMFKVLLAKRTFLTGRKNE